MTPATISVESWQLIDGQRSADGMTYTAVYWCEYTGAIKTERTSDGRFRMGEGPRIRKPALLQQLAERDAALEREQGVREDAQRQLRAAERARDGMREQLRIESALLLAWARESREGGWSTHQVDPMKRRAGEIDAFLAASGGA